MKIAVWYHGLLSGQRMPSEERLLCLFQHQMNALKQSGLAAAADEIHIGLNGNDELLASCFVPERSVIHIHPKGESELPTLYLLRASLKPGWFVLYHHMKGAQHANNAACDAWRNNMERVCVWGWRECVKELEKGYDTVGTQWIVPHPGTEFPPGQRYWAGNFWWARSEYLAGLKPLVEPQYHNRTEFENRYEAEVWIGKSYHNPRIMNFP